MSLPALLLITLCAALILGPIWFSVKARPIGSLPYKWGLYVGIETGGVGIILLAFALSAFGKGVTSGGIVLTLFAFLAVTTSVGIILRKHWGVLAFVATYTLLILVPAFNANTDYRPGSNTQGQSIPTLVFLIITILYFKKRWKLMGGSTHEVSGYTDIKPKKGVIYTESELEAMRNSRPD
jgi:hypothetical protein